MKYRFTHTATQGRLYIRIEGREGQKVINLHILLGVKLVLHLVRQDAADH